MSDNGFHERKEHIRHNQNGTISEIPKTLVSNSESSAGESVDKENKSIHRDSLMGLNENVAEPEQMSEETIEEKANLLNKLMRAPVVDSAGKPLKGEMAKLATIRSIIDSLGIFAEDRGEADDIMFALENPDWSSEGFNRKEHLPWLALEMNAKEAGEWSREGFSPFGAQKWSNVWVGRAKLSPVDARNYENANMELHEALGWARYGFPSEEAVKWYAAGESVEVGFRWQIVGVRSPQERDEWVALGVDKPGEVDILKKLGSESAQKWVDAGMEDLVKALRWNRSVKENYTEKDLIPIMNNVPHITLEEFYKWQEQNIPVDQIPLFMKKGYTPKRAATRIKKGVDASKAENLKGSSLVPGKTWSQVHQKLEQSSANDGSTFTTEHSFTGDYGNIVKIIKTSGSYAPIQWERNYTVRFTNTGRFVEARGTDLYANHKKISDLTARL